MEWILAGAGNVKVILDDMLNTRKAEDKQLKSLQLELTRLIDNGLNVKPAKCNFF